MKNLSAALILALGACSALSPTPDDGTVAGPVSGPTTTTTTTATTATTQAGTPSELSAPPSTKGTPITEPGGSTTTSTPTVPAPAVDPTRRFEYAEVTVDLGDPVGMRALVPYLLKPETWTLVKCEMLSATSKHYKFQKVTSNDGRSLPDVDIFKTRR